MFSYYFPFSCGILGRLQDESKLCLTNSPVLFSLHGKLAQTADIIRSKTIFFLNIFPVLPPSQADMHCCCSVVYPIRVVSTTSQYFVFCFFFLNFVSRIGTCVRVCMKRVFMYLPLSPHIQYVHFLCMGGCMHLCLFAYLSVWLIKETSRKSSTKTISASPSVHFQYAWFQA